MNFGKSVNGYNPAEVENYESQLLIKHENEKKEIILAIENANKEYQNLEEQKRLLTGNLQTVRDSGLFFHNYEKHFGKTLDEAKMDALEKLEEINLEKQTFIKKVQTEISKIEEHVLVLKNDMAKTNQAIEQVIDGIAIRPEIDEQINQLEQMINKFSAQTIKTEDQKIPTAETPPKAEAIKYEPLPPVSSLPLVRPVPVPDPVGTKTQAEYVQTTSAYKHPKSVLIAEKDQDTSAILNSLMEREGYQVHLVEDSYAVVDMTNELEPVGVILLDSLLPNIEINALIKQIRSSAKWCNVPILVTTSEQQKTNSIKLLESGANDFIEKPFNPRELTARVNRLNQSITQPCM